MSNTTEIQYPAVSNGERQAAKELCANLQGLGLLTDIEGDSQSRHKAWLLTAKGKDAMSFKMCHNVEVQVENAR